MNKDQKLREKEIVLELEGLSEARKKIDKLKHELDCIYAACKHEDAYINGYNTDSHEGRSYYEILCPDCVETWEERSNHCTIKLTREEYLSNQRQAINIDK